MGRRKFIRQTVAAGVAGALVLALAACAGASGTTGAKAGGSAKIVMGFAQVGAESGWRTANTISIQGAAKKAGVELKFSDAQQQQENQIKAIRSYIQQKVSIIGFSPVVETGWDTVLKEAKDAGIPVILTDRAVDSKDKSLYVTFLGSDFVAEGQKAGDWTVKEFGDTPTNVVVIEGTTGAAPAIDRKTGFDKVIAAKPNIKVIASQTGDFTRAGGKQVMEAFLKSNPKIDMVFAQNDDMALGAIEAIEEAGKVPGKDIKIVSEDGVKDGLTALAAGKINFIVECNPLLGPTLMDTAKKVLAGKTVPKRIVMTETTFTQDQAKAALPTRQY